MVTGRSNCGQPVFFIFGINMGVEIIAQPLLTETNLNFLAFTLNLIEDRRYKKSQYSESLKILISKKAIKWIIALRYNDYGDLCLKETY